MSYNSIEFLLFFVCFMAVYLIMPRVWLRQLVILAGSVVFYLFNASFSMLAVIVFASVVVYAFTRCMERTYLQYEQAKEGLTPKEASALLGQYKKKNRIFLVPAIVIIVGMLVYVKIGRLYQLPEVKDFKDITWKAILVPLGISYYTFSSVGYLLDVYWRKAKCEHNYLRLLLCMTYFPSIVQGPINRYDKMMKQFGELPGFSYERVCFGLQRMLWGVFKKIVVADRLALFTAAVSATPQDFAGVEIVLSVVLGALQLYADFSGCMDIVIGAAQVMGVTMEENFREPFFSKNAAEFWRRWHMTLGAWFKDYICMPIAINPHIMKLGKKIRTKWGNRASQNFTTLIPLAVTWVLTGIWHGTGVGYLLWGIYWGTVIFLGGALAPEFKKLSQLLHIDTESISFRIFQNVRTFLLFCGGRVFNVAGSIAGLKLLVKQTFAEHRLWTLFDGSLYTHGLDEKDFRVAIMGLIMMWGVAMLHQKGRIRETLAKQPLVFRWIIYLGGICLVLVFGMYGTGYDAKSFLYGGF